MKTLQKIGRWVRTLLTGGVETPEQRRADWESIHQPFELRFHQGHNYRWDEDAFRAQWDEIFGSFLGYSIHRYGEGETLLDLGCGSRPVLDWFDGPAVRYHLDPLLDQYQQIPAMAAHWADKPTETLFNLPAESFVEALAGRCDFVNCWNVLDHTYDWRQILENIRDYTHVGSQICLGTDLAEHGEGHPGIDDEEYFFRFLKRHFHTVAERRNFVHREIALHLVRR